MSPLALAYLPTSLSIVAVECHQVPKFILSKKKKRMHTFTDNERSNKTNLAARRLKVVAMVPFRFGWARSAAWLPDGNRHDTSECH